MSDTLRKVQLLSARGEVRISAHGYDEFADSRCLGHPQGPSYSSGHGDRVSPRSVAMVWRFHDTSKAMTRKTIKLVREGKYAAEVPVELIEEEGGWSPYLSVEDATKLDTVRRALRNEDLAVAAKHGRVFELTPVSA